MKRLFILFAPLLLGACQAGEGGQEGAGLPGEADDERPYAGIAENETVHFTGTEPFWGGQASGGILTWRIPENPDGTAIPVERFAGRNGVSFSGEMGGRGFILAATEGECSDGMSDRTYPFAVTAQIGEEIRHGCGWTGSRPFEGATTP